jgi:membrane protein implicated in regulation of membrane protease activity
VNELADKKMLKRFNARLILTIIISLIDEAIIIFILFFVLSLFGIEMPLWLIITLVLALSALTYVVYRALSKKPLLGFESMIGKSGLTVSPITRKGTIRIGNELWSSETNYEYIEAGVEVIVTGQTGLKLNIRKKIQKPAEE